MSGGTAAFNVPFDLPVGAVLEIDLEGSTGYDDLHVSGQATLAGLLRIEPINARAGTYTLLTYGSRTGTFTVANLGAYDGGIVYDDAAGEVRLTLLHDVLKGDANMDLVVDDTDLSIILSNWGLGNQWRLGDFTNDGTVDDNDLAVLLGNWTGPAALSGVTAIPEPATTILLALGAAVGLSRRRKR